MRKIIGFLWLRIDSNERLLYDGVKNVRAEVIDCGVAQNSCLLGRDAVCIGEQSTQVNIPANLNIHNKYSFIFTT